jgi:hypothetical protein
VPFCRSRVRICVECDQLRDDSANRTVARVVIPIMHIQYAIRDFALSSCRTIASVLLVAPLFVAGGAHAKDAAELAKEKAARKQALKEKAKKTQVFQRNDMIAFRRHVHYPLSFATFISLV